MIVASLEPIRPRLFVNRRVLVKLQEGHEVRGVLIAAYYSLHGGLGNLFVKTENGTSFIRGNAVWTVGLRRTQ